MRWILVLCVGVDPGERKRALSATDVLSRDGLGLGRVRRGVEFFFGVICIELASVDVGVTSCFAGSSVGSDAPPENDSLAGTRES